jgi:hypothetical protein
MWLLVLDLKRMPTGVLLKAYCPQKIEVTVAVFRQVVGQEATE